MIRIEPLLAAWMDLAVYIIVGAIALIQFLVKQMREAKARRELEQRREFEQQGRRPEPQRDQAQRDQASPLRDEVEEFLRRATKKQQESSRRPDSTDTSQRSQKQRGRKHQNPPKISPPPAAQLVPSLPPQPRQPLRTSLEQQRLDTQEFDNRASQLTHLDQVDEQTSQRMHDVFDHRLGDLAAPEPVAAEAGKPAEAAQPASMAAQIRAMFADPRSVRQAVILNEILTPPEHRW